MDRLLPPTSPLVGAHVTIRSAGPGDVGKLRRIQEEPSVMGWWGEPEDEEALVARAAGEDGEVLMVIEIGGQVAGGIELWEETEPSYRHAGIDVFISTPHQNRGVGTEAVALLARYAIEVRGHHRLTIDPAVENVRAIRCYEKVGFRRVGVMREYERGLDGSFHDGLLMDLLAGELRGA